MKQQDFLLDKRDFVGTLGLYFIKITVFEMKNQSSTQRAGTPHFDSGFPLLILAQVVVDYLLIENEVFT